MKVLLFTGGLDSVMLWRRLPKPITLAYVAQPASPYTSAELLTLTLLSIIEPTLRSDMLILRGAEWAAPEPDGHVRHRNLGLIVQAAAVTGAQHIYLGSVRGESSPDKSRRFLRAASRALSASEHQRIRIHAPLRKKTKAAHLRDHLACWPEDRKLLATTRSCYAAEGQCGECNACLRRWVAFKLAGMPAENHRTAPWKRSWEPRRSYMRYVLGTPPSEWLGMLANHRDALCALALQREEERWTRSASESGS